MRSVNDDTKHETYHVLHLRADLKKTSFVTRDDRWQLLIREGQCMKADRASKRSWRLGVECWRFLNNCNGNLQGGPLHFADGEQSCWNAVAGATNAVGGGEVYVQSSWDGGMYVSARYSEVLVLHGSHPLQVS